MIYSSFQFAQYSGSPVAPVLLYSDIKLVSLFSKKVLSDLNYPKIFELLKNMKKERVTFSKDYLNKYCMFKIQLKFFIIKSIFCVNNTTALTNFVLINWEGREKLLKKNST